jgi:hypothetical protein
MARKNSQKKNSEFLCVRPAKPLRKKGGPVGQLMARGPFLITQRILRVFLMYARSQLLREITENSLSVLCIIFIVLCVFFAIVIYA